jgi:hypothetical protein
MQIAGTEIELRAPLSGCVAWEVVALEGTVSQLRARSAALALCWGESNRWRPRPQLSEHGFSPPKWAEAVANDLFSRGATLAEISEVGAEAMRLVRESLPGMTKTAVEAARDFSAGQGGS